MVKFDNILVFYSFHPARLSRPRWPLPGTRLVQGCEASGESRELSPQWQTKALLLLQPVGEGLAEKGSWRGHTCLWGPGDHARGGQIHLQARGPELLQDPTPRGPQPVPLPTLGSAHL